MSSFYSGRERETRSILYIWYHSIKKTAYPDNALTEKDSKHIFISFDRISMNLDLNNPLKKHAGVNTEP